MPAKDLFQEIEEASWWSIPDFNLEGTFYNGANFENQESNAENANEMQTDFSASQCMEYPHVVSQSNQYAKESTSTPNFEENVPIPEYPFLNFPTNLLWSPPENLVVSPVPIQQEFVSGPLKKNHSDFTPDLVVVLEKQFVEKRIYFKPANKVDLTKTLKVTHRQVMGWFRNRRFRDKRQNSEASSNSSFSSCDSNSSPVEDECHPKSSPEHIAYYMSNGRLSNPLNMLGGSENRNSHSEFQPVEKYQSNQVTYNLDPIAEEAKLREEAKGVTDAQFDSLLKELGL